MPSEIDWKACVRSRLGPLPVDAVREIDILDELAQHVADHHRELVASGVDHERAIALALAPLAERAAAEIARADRRRPASPPPPTSHGIGGFAHDLRYAFRLLNRAPAFAAAAIVALALGIGANVAIFSIVRAVILRPPAYRDPSSVIVFLNSRGAAPTPVTSSSFPDFEDWQRQLTAFESLGIMAGWTFNISGLDLPERVYGGRVSGSLFQLLGTRPLLGRVIEPSDDRPDGDEVVVLGYRVWQRLFAGDRGVIGRA